MRSEERERRKRKKLLWRRTGASGNRRAKIGKKKK